MVLKHSFLENMLLAVEVSPVQILTGSRISDRLVAPDKESQINSVRSVNSTIIHAVGNHFDSVVLYDPLKQTVSHASGQAVEWLKVGEGKTITMTLDKALDAVPQESATATLLIIEDGDFLFESPAAPRERELSLLHLLNRKCEQAVKTPTGKNVITILLKFRNTCRVPVLLTANPLIRQIPIGSACRDERAAFANVAINRMPEQLRSPEAVEKLVAVSENMQIDELNSIVDLCCKKGQSLADIEHIARGVRIGVTDSPWAGANLRAALRKAEELIGKRVKGQRHVIAPTIQALKRAALNLSGAHTKSAQAPRLVLWLSGPTGTGKTELAKTIAELIFGDENAIVRFDCAEFADAHSDARLIGSPPGYVGHESGGELTEAVREKPFSVILLDEIEKAHPRILDKFLAILDDGRLSDGQGRTVNFSETVIVFSSNLGMSDRSVPGLVECGADYTLDTPFEDLEKGVRNAVEEHFVKHLGRPELLGRIGKENIFVFDFIREDVAAEILAKMVKQILCRTEENTGIRVVLASTSREDLRRLCLNNDVLQLGGRGIAKKLEAVFTTRLADILFDRLDDANKECMLLSVKADGLVIQ
jgi:hypothetical protein